jgi:uncharacterized protein (DUF2267 family)
MSATGLQVFDRTLQITNIWLNEISDVLGPDRKMSWAVLGAVLRTLRDRLPTNVSAHLGAELPLLVRGAYYDHYQPARQPTDLRTSDQFLNEVEQQLAGQRPVDLNDAVRAVFTVLDRHLPPSAIEKVRLTLPEGIRKLWVVEPQARRGEEGGRAEPLGGGGP